MFAVTAEMLSPLHGATEQILDDALSAIEGTPFCEQFAQRSATRAVVKAALGNSSGEQHAFGKPRQKPSVPDGQSEIWLVEDLPWAERAAFYLRNILCYSRRDSALLLGVSDAHLDQLTSFAERRIAAIDRVADRAPVMSAEKGDVRPICCYEELKAPSYSGTYGD